MEILNLLVEKMLMCAQHVSIPWKFAQKYENVHTRQEKNKRDPGARQRNYS
jgi:hypothetical protein